MPEFYVIADMEGVTGLSSYERELYPGCPEYPRARESLIDDMRAVLDGARSAGADRFAVYDVHFRGDNLVDADLGPGVTLYPGKPRENGMRRGQAGLFILGLHAMAGNPHGVLPHTYNHETELIEINGQPVGEIGMEAYGAGALGIPLCLVAADEEGCREAEALVPGVVTVPTKRLREDGTIELYDGEAVRSRLHDAAARAVSRAAAVAPLPDRRPARVTVRYADPETTRRMAGKSGAELLDDRTLLITAPDTHAAYERFRLTQIRS